LIRGERSGQHMGNVNDFDALKRSHNFSFKIKYL
jgi:hypothetical protein